MIKDEMYLKELNEQGRTLFSCDKYVEAIEKYKKAIEQYIAGIDTDCCVLATATSLFERNIRPVVLAHYCASNGGERSHAAALTVLERTIGAQQIIK